MHYHNCVFCSKECARSTIAENYEDVVSCFHGEIAVRVNSPSSRLAYDDISIIFGCPLPPTAVVFPKIHDPKELQWVGSLIIKRQCLYITVLCKLIGLLLLFICRRILYFWQIINTKKQVFWKILNNVYKYEV